MDNYRGDVIEESLADASVLKKLHIVATRVRQVTPAHKTPWLTQWTLHTIEVPEDAAQAVAGDLSGCIDSEHPSWYIDFRNEQHHYVIFPHKVFRLERNSKAQYEEMRAYGIQTGIPEYQLPNFADLPLDVLTAFLREANLNTYANEHVEKATPLRPGSNDYHFEKGDLAFHDTYFGGTKFMGEEVVYKSGKPAWGMNYYGFTLNQDISENVFDAILRPALMSGSGDNIPVRGPKEFVNGKWKYTFSATGTLENFTGIEEIAKNGEVVCRLYCHGGMVE